MGVRVRRLIGESMAVGTTALAIVFAQLQLWRAAWDAPFTVGGDATFYLMVIRGLGENGSYLKNPSLGWPFGQTMYDLPQGVDNLHLLVLRFLAVVTGGPGAAINWFYILSFFAVAAMTHAVVRLLGIRWWIAAVTALLYAFLPYHFARNEGHLLLSGYQLVPVAVLVALKLFECTPPFVDWRNRRTWWLVAAVIGLASTGSYYFIFFLGLVVLSAAMAAAGQVNWKGPVRSAGTIIVVGGVMFAINVLPTLVYQARHGANPGVANRSPLETELYGLRISQLFMPRIGHRIAPLAKVALRSQGKVVPSEPGQQLGVIGAIGLAMLLFTVAGAALGRLRGPTATRLVRLGLLALACMLVATVSGAAVFISAGGLSYIRGWNRVSVVIGFVALAAVAIVVEHVVAARPGRRWLAPAIAVGLLGVGWVDQLSPADRPPFDQIAAREATYRPFFRATADTVGPGGSVFTWPHLGFPEVPDRGGTGAYDQALGYVYEPGVNWSFGFVRGRYPDYPFAFEKQPAREWLTSVVAIGFRALLIDRFSTLGANPAPDVGPDVEGVLGPPNAVSADGRYALFDLHRFADEVGATGLGARASAALAAT